MFNNIHRIIAVMAILALFVSAAAGAVVTQDVEIRGAVANGSTTYDYTNFGALWYDIDKDRGSESFDITVVNRTIYKGNLIYTCTPVPVSYKNKVLNDTYGRYVLMGFRANKYLCYDGKTDKLVKLLIEWGSSNKIILSMDDPMELPEGYMLSAQEIDLQGDRVWLKLYKDGISIDDSIVEGGKTYTYEDEDDVLLFSAKIDSVFRGTVSNMVVVKYVFMRSDNILDIDGGDNFGVMEVKSTASSGIILENDDVLTLDSDSEVEIMDGLYFKVADDSSNLRYYLAKTVSLVCPECPECPVVEPCPEQTPCEPCPEVVPTEVATEPVTATEPEKEDKDDDDGGSTLPGFEAVFALAGLLAVACIVLRQRE